MRLLISLCLLSLLLPAPLSAQEADGGTPAVSEPQEVVRSGRTGLPLPRFVSLRASEVNLRAGPGFRYPVEWVYRRSGQPVEVIDEYETWRRIRDWEGTEGWVHQSMLQGTRTARVTSDGLLLRREAGNDAPPVARLEVGAIGQLRGCEQTWCRLDFAGLQGWLPRDGFYGAYADEASLD
ncbi:SH3 domain-containing protein [Aquibaculum sediminis]|uniref:SH3 domain-containing protein n=1 Tax=Aquibaculum sediminis TaxID=3231907 RepID=UPI003451DACB